MIMNYLKNIKKNKVNVSVMILDNNFKAELKKLLISMINFKKLNIIKSLTNIKILQLQSKYLKINLKAM